MKNSQSIIIGSKKVRFLPVTRRTLMIVAKVTVKTRTIDLSVPLGGSTVVCVEIDASLAHFKLSIEVLWDWSVGEEISSLELDMDFMIESLRVEYELKDEMWDPSNWILRNCRLKYAERHTAKWESVLKKAWALRRTVVGKFKEQWRTYNINDDIILGQKLGKQYWRSVGLSSSSKKSKQT